MQYGAVFQLVKYAKGQLSTTARFWKKKKNGIQNLHREGMKSEPGSLIHR